MTQSNQSELRNVISRAIRKHEGVELSSEIEKIAHVMDYITANYTPNSEVLNIRLHSAATLANLDQKITHLEAEILRRDERITELKALEAKRWIEHTPINTM